MLEYVLFVAGLALLVKGADVLVEGSSSLAKKFGLPVIVIGLTVVAFGTSLPELIVNVFAAVQGVTDIALGNVIGSNLANTLLIMGATALVLPFVAQRTTVLQEIPFNLFAVLVLFVAANDLLLESKGFSLLSRIDGLIFLIFFAVFIYYILNFIRKNRNHVPDGVQEHTNPRIALMVVGGLIALFFGGRWVVEGAVAIARNFGVSEFMVSATIIAFGTSLPELVTCVIAALKKRVDLAVGNVMGSNIFNIFWVLGLTSVITPLPLMPYMNTDLIFLCLASFLLMSFMYIGIKHKLERWQGFIFVFLYLAYLAFIVFRG